MIITHVTWCPSEAVSEDENESWLLCLQTTASQRARELNQLNSKISNLERQLNHTTLLKEKAEQEREAAKSDAAETKVLCMLKALSVFV